jgi:hypothetical protein
MIQAFLQKRWGGFILTTRERKYGQTVACGSWEAMYAALRLFNPPKKGAWANYRLQLSTHPAPLETEAPPIHSPPKG